MTLSACAMADELINHSCDHWTQTLRAYGLNSLHMSNLSLPAGCRDRLECDIFNLLGEFRREFFYLRVCSVVLATMRRQNRGIRP